MAVRIELFDPQNGDQSWLAKHANQILTLSQTFNQTVEGAWCDIPKRIKQYTIVAFAVDDEQGETVVGFASALSFDHYTHWSLSATILNEQHKERRIGSDMTHALIDYALDHGAQEVWVHTENDNMIQFFTKNGFRRTGKQFTLYKSPS